MVNGQRWSIAQIVPLESIKEYFGIFEEFSKNWFLQPLFWFDNFLLMKTLWHAWPFVNGWVIQSNASYIMAKAIMFSPIIIDIIVSVIVFSLFKIFTFITKIFHLLSSLRSQSMKLLIIQKNDLQIIVTCCYRF